ncbi:Predicted arabinose efflux permease, MFS family [Sulfurivirga caldicuralii]|uniref:Predicted arabinose efflux permease, MFS family n=1 Tax=Sulfurivirga caldicuralii TaxID=364032 RepID=A0A1N6DTH8_9GAMM|nr:organoarsenical effux MFS transporter ArsJ [Sulfurivirga caldicuralii]SIN74095.1 Predicted arabinose efflux permease, MFS family [Sulfurivirga caldicuralii]
MDANLRQYALITGNYWAFTITDGAIRMLVLFYFYQLGYSPFAIATLFVLYELAGVFTNLIGGWLGARWGLNVTMNVGLALQIVALMMLTVPDAWLTVPYVMFAQMLSGIAKDLNKMSAKSSVKLLADDASGQLYRWVAALTGSKNALKGVGFFVGAALLQWVGFREALYILSGMLVLVLTGSLLFLKADLGKAKSKPKFTELFSKSPALNWLSGARLFLFAARDVWFVVALPVYLEGVLGWSFVESGGFMALWVIGYGFIQGMAPTFTKRLGERPSAHTASLLAFALAAVPLAMAALFDLNPTAVLMIGLTLFGILFALNSAVHSYLIVAMATEDGVSKDVGFYYMANAGGRLAGTLLSGALYQLGGMHAVLYTSAAFILLAAILVRKAEPEE